MMGSWVQNIKAAQDTPWQNHTIQFVLRTEECEIKGIDPVLFYALEWAALHLKSAVS